MANTLSPILPAKSRWKPRFRCGATINSVGSEGGGCSSRLQVFVLSSEAPVPRPGMSQRPRFHPTHQNGRFRNKRAPCCGGVYRAVKPCSSRKHRIGLCFGKVFRCLGCGIRNVTNSCFISHHSCAQKLPMPPAWTYDIVGKLYSTLSTDMNTNPNQATTNIILAMAGHPSNCTRTHTRYVPIRLTSASRRIDTGVIRSIKYCHKPGAGHPITATRAHDVIRISNSELYAAFCILVIARPMD